MLLTTHFFVNDFLGAGICLKKNSVFHKAVEKGCLFKLPHQGLQGLAIEKSFMWENGAFHLPFQLRGLAIHSIGMCKRTPFHQYVAAVRCSYQCK